MKFFTKSRQEGSAIVVVLSVTITVAMIVAVAMEYTSTVRRNVHRSEVLQSAVSVGDGALEHAFANWREICRQQTNVAPSTKDLASVPLPVQAQFPTVQGFTASSQPADLTLAHPPTVSNFKILAVDPQLNPMGATATPTPGIGKSQNSATWYYLAQADIALPVSVSNSNIVAKVRRVFQKEQLSPWNWAIFYVDPLEIHPGVDMNITGWVHTNSLLYTGHNLLHFLSKVTYTGDWTIGFAPGDARSPTGSSPETPTSPTYVGSLPPAYDVAHQPFGLDATRIFDPTDGNPNNDSYHELLEQRTGSQPDPLVDSTGKSQRYYDQAGVKILVNSASNSFTIKDSANNTVGIHSPLYITFNAALTATPQSSIQDNREAASIRLTTLDMGVVRAKINDGTLTGFNRIIYVADTSASATGGTPKRGIRIKNAAVVPVGGLTVASPNPVYVQGDFNTGGNPPSNSGDPSQPQVTGYTRQPCAVVADAVNILSNAWNDANSSNGLTGTNARTASNTTVNAAIVSGIVPSANNYYSGGAENFPRFLENWSGRTFTYYGSMVELYQSRQSIGRWGSDNVYNPPARQWFFDTNLQVNTPPGSLLVYSYVKGRWFLAQ